MEVTMSKLDLFRDHLDEREYRYRELTDDEGVTRAFIAQHEIKNNQILTVTYEFSEEETFLDLGIFDIAKIEDPSKREAVLDLINELNQGYRFGKFFVSDEGDVVMRWSLFIKDHFDPAVLLDMAFMLVGTIEEAYPKFMKIQWT
ncbi:YbjN domain-containing protein [Megasphaera sp.]|uniref:YbjN domain-containing protein n=3 Tax=Megasphaera TaxID=906 RepID=UPI0027BA1334|nr:YbjN domain-containing protein [Megasphaera sp.]